MSGRRPPWFGIALAIAGFAAVRFLEARQPLRPRREDPLRHDARNLVLASLSALAVSLTEQPIVMRFAGRAEREHLGLLQRLKLPRALEIPCAILLLDYTLYLWHVLLHRVPLLWRCHVVHHLDRDLTASTALRFHFAEILLSIPWRIAQVLLIGVSPRALALWQRAALAEIVWHHSNVRLPPALERVLAMFVVTPRLHGIHHSVVQGETNSNWSSGLTLWDRLHGTLRRDVPQREITTGVPAYRSGRDVSLSRILMLPFLKQRPAWQFADGHPPHRAPTEPRGDLPRE
ncbi:MAG TPA: sterol desaturase family protein [Rhizomicrobium sp.]|jgi:sterol desaturase/sphingolipid hydroxylase (fatty acid hydroxylase superfamily)